MELREAGVDVETDDASVPETDWFGDPVDADGTAEGGDDEEEAEAIDRREAVKTVGRYLVVGLGGYLAVERLSDFVRESPAVRAAVRRRVEAVRARVPDVSASFDFGGTDRSRVEGALPSQRSATGGTRPEDARRVPYHELAADPESFVGTAVRYGGTVDDLRERRMTYELTLHVTPTADDEWTDAVVGWWSAGDLFDDAMSVHLLRREAVTVWGVVDGATRYGRSRPRLRLTDVGRTEA